MPLSGRRPFQHFGVSVHRRWISARGREGAVAEGSPFDFSQPPRDPLRETPLRLASNENPVGPGQHVLDAIVSKFPEAGRYLFNAREQEPALVNTIASKHDVAADHIVLGCGSTEILFNAVRNTAARAITMKAFEQMGFKPTDSQASFIFVKINRPAAGFRDACRKQGVIVGRDFAPYEKTHVRISLGTQVEMYRAIAVFRNVLGSTSRTSEVRPSESPK